MFCILCVVCVCLGLGFHWLVVVLFVWLFGWWMGWLVRGFDFGFGLVLGFGVYGLDCVVYLGLNVCYLGLIVDLFVLVV